MANKQQYGLFLNNKKQLSAPKAGNVFGNDDDSEEEEGTDWVKKALKAEHEKNKSKKQTQLNMQRALQEDPTIYQYDEVYDDMERTKEEEMKAVKKVEKKPKYINSLLKSAELRKKEQELRKDRMIQKEIEAEDAMFPDKERYVTSSYKAKLEEMKKFEEEQADKDRLEAIVDVTKQKDMSGFYRHLYRQTVEKNEADLGIVPEIKKSSEKNDKPQLPLDIDKDDPIPSDSESDESNKSGNEDERISKKSALSKAKIKRQYRKRAQEESESESEPEPEKEIQESSEKTSEKDVENKSEAEPSAAKKPKLSEEIDKEKLQEVKKSASIETENQNNDTSTKAEKETTKKDDKDKEEEKPKEVEKPKRKVNIWVKRTVGPVFEAALERYLIRKQQRLAGS